MVIVRERTAARRANSAWLESVALIALAFVARMAFVLSSSGGLRGVFGYDAAVYYTSAASFLNGAVPYRDFTLLHPPGLMLALTPFAAVGRVTTDHTGFIVADVAFVLLASVNAALVAAIARRLGLPRAAALSGGLFYAVWLGAIDAEVSPRLEPLGSFAFLCGLWLLTRAATSPRRAVLAAGVAMGAAGAVKIWWVVPSLVVLAWLLSANERRPRAAPFAAGLAAGLAVVMGPFFLAAPSAMWRMVVTDQLGRHPGGALGLARLTALGSVYGGVTPLAVGIVVAVAVVFLGLTIRACGSGPGRLVALILGAQVLVLLAAPTYFGYYSGYVASTASLLVAAAGHDVRPRAVRGVPAGIARIAVVGAAAASGVALLVGTSLGSTPFPAGRLARGLGHVRCVQADSPMALIELDALSRDLRNGCQNWVDVTGRTYDVDASGGGPHHGRRTNARWQADVLRYLRSGGATILIRSATGLSPATLQQIRSWQVLVRAGNIAVYRPPDR